MEFSIDQIAQIIGAKVEGDGNVKVRTLAKIEEATPEGLSFLANPKYERFIYETHAGGVIVSLSFVPKSQIKSTLLRVDDPYLAFSKLLEFYQSFVSGIDEEKEEPSYIHPTAFIGENTRIGAFAYIAKNARIGKNCLIHPHTFIGAGAVIGDNCTLWPGVRIGHLCEVGNNCTFQHNAVIGSDGFGFAPSENGYSKVAQTGNVVLGDNVDVGANTCIDRATLGSTKIGNGVKLDNLVQIAHNVEIGDHTVMAGQSGVAGSTKIGSFCMFGGQVGISGHLTIGNKVKAAAQTGISKSLNDNEVVMGSPAMPAGQYNRSYAVFKRLPDFMRQLNDMIKKTSSE
jgi:UDP-3-O-[3-hydroxymyristoyl] glucosamine N-acyltransferase